MALDFARYNKEKSRDTNFADLDTKFAACLLQCGERFTSPYPWGCVLNFEVHPATNPEASCWVMAVVFGERYGFDEPVLSGRNVTLRLFVLPDGHVLLPLLPAIYRLGLQNGARSASAPSWGCVLKYIPP